MRRAAASLALTLVVACAGTPGTATTGDVATTVTTTPGATATTAMPPTTSTTSPVTTSSPPTTEAGEAAPDFTFELGDGSTFVLSAEQKPVFMVFWAEW